MNGDEDLDEGYFFIRLEEFPTVQSSIKKYDSELFVSRDVFKSFDSETKPWLTPRPIDSVYERLFEDFSRRQEAKSRLVTILDLKNRKSLKDSLHIPNFNERKVNRSLSKPEVKDMVGRLNEFWNKKWNNIEKKKKIIAEAKEDEIRNTVRVKFAKKSNPDSFKRLTTPKVSGTTFQSQEVKKKFSIKEAIESGKRLMHAKRFSLSGTLTPRASISLARTPRLEDSEPKRPSTRKEEVRDIEEIIQRCKNKALSLNFSSKGFNFDISETENFSLLPAKN
jgi:hypothetical protein